MPKIADDLGEEFEIMDGYGDEEDKPIIRKIKGLEIVGEDDEQPIEVNEEIKIPTTKKGIKTLKKALKKKYKGEKQ